MSVVVMIPARYGSARLPGKALLSETGKCLIQHVVESVAPAKCADRVIVATDDQRIADAVVGFGGQAVLTSPNCRTGTDRLAEAAEKLGLSDDDVVVNVQGDEPEMSPQCVDEVVRLLVQSEAPIATLATPISSEQADQLNLTKVVRGADGTALYFSRAKIPHDRDSAGGVEYLLHHGIYAYRVAFLKVYASLASTPAEQAEKLEQLRALAHGYAIAVGLVSYRGARIDTPEEYARFAARMKENRS